MRGIVARDGGHFDVMFDDDCTARKFIEKARDVVAKKLPGIRIDHRVETIGAAPVAEAPAAAH